MGLKRAVATSIAQLDTRPLGVHVPPRGPANAAFVGDPDDGIRAHGERAFHERCVGLFFRGVFVEDGQLLDADFNGPKFLELSIRSSFQDEHARLWTGRGHNRYWALRDVGTGSVGAAGQHGCRRQGSQQEEASGFRGHD